MSPDDRKMFAPLRNREAVSPETKLCAILTGHEAGTIAADLANEQHIWSVGESGRVSTPALLVFQRQRVLRLDYSRLKKLAQSTDHDSKTAERPSLSLQR